MPDQPTQAEWEEALFRKMDTCRFHRERKPGLHNTWNEWCEHHFYKPVGEWDWHMDDCEKCTLWKLRVEEKQGRLF